MNVCRIFYIYFSISELLYHSRTDDPWETELSLCYFSLHLPQRNQFGAKKLEIPNINLLSKESRTIAIENDRN